MKTTLSLLLVTILFATGRTATAQETPKVSEDTLIVAGICNMCKSRIEEAAYIKGVKYASWNKETDELSIAYRNDKVSLDDIRVKLLATGHKVGEESAPREAYESLPDCCRYETLHKH